MDYINNSTVPPSSEFTVSLRNLRRQKDQSSLVPVDINNVVLCLPFLPPILPLTLDFGICSLGCMEKNAVKYQQDAMLLQLFTLKIISKNSQLIFLQIDTRTTKGKLIFFFMWNTQQLAFCISNKIGINFPTVSIQFFFFTLTGADA